MESTELATLIVGGVCVIGLIEFVGWIFVVIRHPGYEDLRPDFDANAKCSSLWRTRTPLIRDQSGQQH